MIYILLMIIVISVLIAPQLIIAHTLKKYNTPSNNIPGTGAQFARHLLTRLNLSDSVKVEESEQSDHYDPQTRTIRLSKNYFNQHSTTAMVIAAHEVGHAIQHAENYPWLSHRVKLTKIALVIAKIAPVTLLVAPVLFALTKSPLLSLLIIIVGVLSIGISVLIHLVTLPVEIDASFNKALPILETGNYFENAADYSAARDILKAAAMTYVAQSLFNLLNVAYWIKILKP
jgi:Zn-dependent membrane protease YugP